MHVQLSVIITGWVWFHLCSRKPCRPEGSPATTPSSWPPTHTPCKGCGVVWGVCGVVWGVVCGVVWGGGKEG